MGVVLPEMLPASLSEPVPEVLLPVPNARDGPDIMLRRGRDQSVVPADEYE
jgi:hypothetical protein